MFSEFTVVRHIIETVILHRNEGFLTACGTVPDRCSGRLELKKEIPEDKVLKAEIYELLNEADCSKVLVPSMPVSQASHVCLN